MTTFVMKDGSRRAIASGIAFADLLKELPEGMRRNAVAFKAGKLLLDLRTNVPDGAEISVVTVQDPEALEVLRHSVSHLMALAVHELYPGVRFGIGPSIDDGFYYDFLMDAALNP
jgi:threonyl-tRNA synthetase